MSKYIIGSVVAAALAVTSVGSAQVTTGRIVIVDLEKVFAEYHKTPVAQEKLKETVNSFNKEAEDMVSDFRKQTEEYNKLRDEADKPEYTAEVREKKRKELQEKLADLQKRDRELREYRQSHQQILQQQQQRMRDNILKEITDVIVKEAQGAGYAMVMDKSGKTLNGVPTIVWTQDTLEITDNIIKILNKNAPKTLELPKLDEKKEENK